MTAYFRPWAALLALPLLALPLLAAPLTVLAASPAAIRYVHKVEDAPGKTPASRRSGFQEALGTALAKQLQRPLRLMPLPRKRMMNALEAADGDIVCGYSPAWFVGQVDWTRPFIPTSEVLIASRRVPAPASLEDIRGKTVGTVLGFNYPEVQRRLGSGFVRDDAPSLELTLRKWQGGRFDYFLATGVTVERQFVSGELAAGFNQLVISEEKTGCAIARRGTLRVAEVNAAIDAIEKSGELARVLRLR
ncbi:MAG: transporter substrate-binding domain-containing protein [Duganella sp.]